MTELHSLRHSAAHVLAEAVGSVFPGTRFHIGPATDTGFFYDVELPDCRVISSDDLPRIENEMRRISERNTSFERRVIPRDEAIELFTILDQPFKVARIEGFDAETEISVFDQGGFVDLCRGPHVERTGQVTHVKLTQAAGAYANGDANAPRLQRIHGVVFPDDEQLQAWLTQQEEAARRDHRRLGRELELFMSSTLSPGAVFWLPNGEALYHTLQVAMRSLLLSEGYVVVNTPLILDHALWKTSGHLDHYHKNMFHIAGGEEITAGEQPHRGLKPMNCPCHMLIFGSQRRSHRDLPMRIHDQGVLHRNEQRGALGGLTRVRQFCQDDAHIFCTPEQVRDEVVAMIELVNRVYPAFGLAFTAKLSTRPQERLGDEGLWDRAEEALVDALSAVDLDYTVKAGSGAFYGPKIDFDVRDAIGREFQCATIQLDFQLPRSFELQYVGSDGERHTPVVVHRAIFGSFERFIGILIEHFAGAFPAWLSPESARVATVTNQAGAHAQRVLDALQEAGIRAKLDDTNDKIGKKVRAWHVARTPFLAVIGERERASNTVMLRTREGDQEVLSTDAFVARLVAETRVPFLERNAKAVRP